MLKVYVIQVWRPYLSRAHRELPWVYVGSTAHELDHRLLQHREGGLTATKMLKDGYFWRLRPELYDDLPFAASRPEAERLERERAIRLGRAGFTAWSDGRGYSVPANDLEPFTARELQPVRKHLEQHIDSVRKSAHRPLGIGEITSVLRWQPTSTVRHLVPTPSPDAGRFRHAEPAALQQLIKAHLAG